MLCADIEKERGAGFEILGWIDLFFMGLRCIWCARNCELWCQFTLVAQLVEHRTPNPRVGGSSPSERVL